MIEHSYYINERRSKCKTKGELQTLYNWWFSLPYSEQERYQREHEKKRAEEYRLYMEELRAEQARKCEEKARKDRELHKQMYMNNRNPNSLNEGEAVVLWLIVMGVSIMFKHFWLIWIIATYLLYRYFTYETRRELEWERKYEDKEKYEEELKKCMQRR